MTTRRATIDVRIKHLVMGPNVFRCVPKTLAFSSSTLSLFKRAFYIALLVWRLCSRPCTVSGLYSEIHRQIFSWFWFCWNHFGLWRQETKYFPIWSPMNLKKNILKLEKMTFYLVIFAMFKFTVISHCAGHMAIKFALLGTYEITTKRKNFGWIKFNFTT